MDAYLCLLSVFFVDRFHGDLFRSLHHLFNILRPAPWTDGYLSRALVDKVALGAPVFIPDKVIDGKV